MNEQGTTEVGAADIAQTVMELVEEQGKLPVISAAWQAEIDDAIEQTNCRVVSDGRFARFDLRTIKGRTFRVLVEEF